jgi:hypothetical protein
VIQFQSPNKRSQSARLNRVFSGKDLAKGLPAGARLARED